MQTNTKTGVDDKMPDIEIFTIVEEMPEFPGGQIEFNNFIRKNLVYPKSALDKKISGKCFMKFVVASDGAVGNVTVLKGVPDCPECDKAAVDVISGMPDWKPGKQNGKNVNVFYTLPLSFRPNN